MCSSSLQIKFADKLHLPFAIALSVSISLSSYPPLPSLRLSPISLYSFSIFHYNFHSKHLRDWAQFSWSKTKEKIARQFAALRFSLGWVGGWLWFWLRGSGVWGFGFGFPRLTVGNIVAAITFITSQRATSPGWLAGCLASWASILHTTLNIHTTALSTCRHEFLAAWVATEVVDNSGNWMVEL